MLPDIPVILGGGYARLCPDHAVRTSEADIVSGESRVEAIRDLLSDLGLKPGPPADHFWHPYAAFDLLDRIDYICLRTSSGCPYQCAYCASPFLDPGFTRRHPDDVLGEILHWFGQFAVCDFAFYDDALLIRGGGFRTGVLEPLIRRGLPLRFTPPTGFTPGKSIPEPQSSFTAPASGPFAWVSKAPTSPSAGTLTASSQRESLKGPFVTSKGQVTKPTRSGHTS